jgi:hypothetical protein
MRTYLPVLASTLATTLLLLSTPASAISWNIAADYSAQSNPNGVWSYNRKWTVDGTAADLMTIKWGTSGWYLGNVGNGGPSIQGNVILWAKNNGNGFPDVRWTAPSTGTFDIVGSFVGADDRGVDSNVYVVINGNIQFSDRVTGYLTSKSFSFGSLQLTAGSTVDFIVTWAGGVNSEYSWTQANATISAVPEPGTSSLLVAGLVAVAISGRRLARRAA